MPHVCLMHLLRDSPEWPRLLLKRLCISACAMAHALCREAAAFARLARACVTMLADPACGLGPQQALAARLQGPSRWSTPSRRPAWCTTPRRAPRPTWSLCSTRSTSERPARWRHSSLEADAHVQYRCLLRQAAAAAVVHQALPRTACLSALFVLLVAGWCCVCCRLQACPLGASRAA